MREPIKLKTAAGDVSTGSLVDELLSLATNVNGLLTSMESTELLIHEAKAGGDPVSNAANDVISIMDQVRPHLDDALGILVDRLGNVMGAPTPAPVEEEPLPEEDEELIEELPEEE